MTIEFMPNSPQRSEKAQERDEQIIFDPKETERLIEKFMRESVADEFAEENDLAKAMEEHEKATGAQESEKLEIMNEALEGSAGALQNIADEKARNAIRENVSAERKLLREQLIREDALERARVEFVKRDDELKVLQINFDKALTKKNIYEQETIYLTKFINELEANQTKVASEDVFQQDLNYMAELYAAALERKSNLQDTIDKLRTEIQNKSYELKEEGRDQESLEVFRVQIESPTIEEEKIMRQYQAFIQQKKAEENIL